MMAMALSDPKYSFSATAYVLALMCCLTIGCRTARVPTAANTPKPAVGTYVDLEPGWRLRVITPLVAGGGYVLKTAPAQEQGNTITLKTGSDFLGYETAYYDVREGLDVRFANAQVMREGKSTPQPKPTHPLFRMGHGMKHMRLVYLERGSATSHDMAVLTAKAPATLDELTVRLQSSAAAGCQRGCEWVPAGIAVRPEMRKSGAWMPAR